jgi:hypothetical protein
MIEEPAWQMRSRFPGGSWANTLTHAYERHLPRLGVPGLAGAGLTANGC